jgi:hypothetical protein
MDLAGLGGKPVDAGRVLEVGLDEPGAAAGRGDLVDGFGAAPGVAAGDHDGHPVGGQPLGDRPADSGRGPGDQGSDRVQVKACVLCGHGVHLPDFLSRPVCLETFQSRQTCLYVST